MPERIQTETKPTYRLPADLACTARSLLGSRRDSLPFRIGRDGLARERWDRIPVGQ